MDWPVDEKDGPTYHYNESNILSNDTNDHRLYLSAFELSIARYGAVPFFVILALYFLSNEFIPFFRSQNKVVYIKEYF